MIKYRVHRWIHVFSICFFVFTCSWRWCLNSTSNKFHSKPSTSVGSAGKYSALLSINVHVPYQYVTTNGVTTPTAIMVSLIFKKRFVQRLGAIIQLYVKVCTWSSSSSYSSIVCSVFFCKKQIYWHKIHKPINQFWTCVFGYV